jgi:hypothetical protein
MAEDKQEVMEVLRGPYQLQVVLKSQVGHLLNTQMEQLQLQMAVLVKEDMDMIQISIMVPAVVEAGMAAAEPLMLVPVVEAPVI